MRDTAILDLYYTPRAELQQAWGDWLSGLASWEWFVTLTLRDPADPRFPNWTKPGWSTAKRAWGGFTGAARPPLGPLLWVMMFEIQKWRGVPHIHALVAGSDCQRMEMVDWAWDNCGITRVLEYDPARGARYYLCKYLTKELSHIEFCPEFGKVARLG